MQRKRVLRYVALGTLVLLGLLGLVLPPGARSLVIQIMIFSIFAMGYDVCLGYTAQCSLGHALFFGAGAYGCVLSMMHLKVGLLPAVAVGMISGFVLAGLLGLICVRLSEAYFVIVTAIIAAVFHLLAMDMAWITGGDDGLSVSIPPIKLGFTEISIYNPLANYYLVLFFLAMSYLVLARILNAPVGRIFVSLRENDKRTLFLGYNVTRYKLIAFMISGVVASLAGALYAVTLRYASADYLGFYWCVLPVVWCLVGGLGTLVGPWVGVALMSVFQYYVSASFTYYLLLFGVLILVILRVSSKGIMGYITSRGER